MHIPQLLRITGKTLSSNSPAILSGMAVAGVVGTVILAVKATPKALHDLGYAREDKQTDADLANSQEPSGLVHLTAQETVKVAWKLYIPAGLTGLATIACIIGANQIGARRNAALLGAYSLADTAFREYKDEVLKQIGVSKEQKIHDEIVKRKIDEHPVTDAQVIITGGGDQLCYETLTGRYFKSDIEKIRRTENEINHTVISEMYVSLNEFFGLLDLGPTTIGDELGWNLDNLCSLVFTSHLASDGRPCLAIGYAKLPRKDYGKF